MSAVHPAAGAGVPVVMAHFGHWYVQLAFVAPVVAVVAWLSVLSWRDRRDERRGRRQDP